MVRVTAPPWTIRCRSRWPGRPDIVIPGDENTSIYEALRSGGRPIASACTGDAVCGRCTVHVLHGAGLTTAMDDEEQGVLERHEADADERLACRTWIRGDGIVVGTDYW